MDADDRDELLAESRAQRQANARSPGRRRRRRPGMSADEYRQFAREQQLRFERLMRELRADWERRAEQMRRRDERLERRLDQVLAEGREARQEAREESRAQREALFRILDRLDGG